MNANERSAIRAIRGPVTLITIGGLFALNNFTQYHFDQTWPVILIVFGLLSLLGRSLERDVPPGPPPGAPPYAQGPWNTQGSWNAPPPPAPPPPAPPPQGSYSQSSYSQPPAGTAKGGFGTTAPDRGKDPAESSGGNV